METYQVWMNGTDCYDFTAPSKEDALAKARKFFNLKRLPPDTFACRISTNYYKRISDLNKTSDFNAANL